MARKPRFEVESGLYHVITRGVDRRDIFHSVEDHRKFISQLTVQKEKLPFYLYAYCLMTNHIHLLIERRTLQDGAPPEVTVTVTELVKKPPFGLILIDTGIHLPTVPAL